MQTFLPYADFRKSAECLDRQRLGKQRVEAWQIIRALRGETKGWVNHPATKMWRGYEMALAMYGLVVCDVWRWRGYKDSLRDKFAEIVASGELINYPLPDWIGDEAFHLSHQSKLLSKLPSHYQQYFAGVPDNLDYVWPVKE